MKTCTKCHKRKPFTAFYKDSTTTIWYRPSCKSCVKIYYIDYYKKKKVWYAQEVAVASLARQKFLEDNWHMQTIIDNI